MRQCGNPATRQPGKSFDRLNLFYQAKVFKIETFLLPNHI
jgi:hypothetical protein